MWAVIKSFKKRSFNESKNQMSPDNIAQSQGLMIKKMCPTYTQEYVQESSAHLNQMNQNQINIAKQNR